MKFSVCKVLMAGLLAAVMFAPVPTQARAAAESNVTVFTLEEAFVRARRNNSSIDALNGSVRFVEQQRRSLVIDEQNAWRFGHGTLDQSAEQARRAIRSIDQTVGDAPANTRMMEAVSDFLVLSSFNTARGIEEELAVLRESIALDEVALGHTELRHSLGLASTADVTAARQGLEQSRAALRAQQIGLGNQMAALNHLLGLPSDAVIEISHELDMEPGGISALVGNIHHYADRVTATDPSIAVLRNQLDIARRNYNSTENWFQNRQFGQTFVNLEANNTDRATMLNALENADRALRDGIDNMREDIRHTYNQLLQLEEQRGMLQVGLARAQEAYANALTSLEAGMITEHEVNLARLAVRNAESAIVANALTYENLLFAFHAPFLLAR